jgi:hypothetical protein
MDRRFFELTTADVTDAFYKAKVEVLEETDDSFTVKDIHSGVRRTFMKRDDPIVVSYDAIEDPTSTLETDELLGFLNREEEDTGNH